MIAFLAISDRCATLFVFEIFDKMAAVGHFGCPKLTFDGISGHFRSIQNFMFFDFLTKWRAAPILDVRNSLSIAFLAISDQYETFFEFFLQNGRQRPFWMSEIHFRSHSLAISDRYATFVFDKMAAVGHLRCPKLTFDRISGHFR